MELSIIIPVYNCESYIERCVNSIFVQLPLDIEIILVNDGSEDSSSSICNHLQLLNERVHVIHQENKGVSAARNAGIKCSKGKYIWFVDADDFLEPNSVKYLLHVLTDNSLDLLQFGNNIVFSDNSYKYLRHSEGSKVLLPNEYLRNGYFNGTAWQSIFLRSLVNDLTLFDEDVKLGQDGLFFVRILTRSSRVMRSKIRAYNYFQNTSSTTYNISFNEALLVAKKVTLTQLPDYATGYVIGFSDFYLALSILSADYKEGQLINYLVDNKVCVDKLFVKKLIQQMLSYRYGMVRVRSPKNERINVLIRVKSFLNKMDLDGTLPKILRLTFNVFGLKFIDLCFNLVVFIFKPYFFCNKS